ncbi:hypothetical protein FIP56_03625 [Francisella sp. LA112445]|nr:hypothetical protein FIP56_03625 [Francisella sp. LA112445]
MTLPFLRPFLLKKSAFCFIILLRRINEDIIRKIIKNTNIGAKIINDTTATKISPSDVKICFTLLFISFLYNI